MVEVFTTITFDTRDDRHILTKKFGVLDRQFLGRHDPQPMVLPIIQDKKDIFRFLTAAQRPNLDIGIGQFSVGDFIEDIERIIRSHFIAQFFGHKSTPWPDLSDDRKIKNRKEKTSEEK